MGSTNGDRGLQTSVVVAALVVLVGACGSESSQRDKRADAGEEAAAGMAGAGAEGSDEVGGIGPLDGAEDGQEPSADAVDILEQPGDSQGGSTGIEDQHDMPSGGDAARSQKMKMGVPMDTVS